MSLPKHKNPTDRNAARAPYNFVPLPEVVVKAVESTDDLPDHNCYVDGRYTGHFEVTLTTKTPLYIRGGLSTKRLNDKTTSEYEQAEAEKSGKSPQDFRQMMKNKPDFFATTDPNKPVIPGSSLRGMLRSLVEIITYSKVQWVTNKKLFFRTMDDSVVGESYRKRMMDNVESGFVRRDGDSYVIRICSMVRVHHEKLGGIGALFDGRAPNQTPKWNGNPHQHMPIWVKLLPGGNFVDEISFDETSGSDWHEGRLIITGNMPGRPDGTGGKKKEFVFLLPAKGAAEVKIPPEILERFHDDDQITQWQQKAFPRDAPRNKGRIRPGLLITKPDEYEEPVFFLRENRQLTFLGRAKMFRLPYQERPLNLIPSSLRDPNDIDYAEAMFGFVRTQEELEQMETQPNQGSKGRAYAGRVFVSDGRYQPNQGSPWMSDAPDGIIEPHILATPKPTAFQHYLTQNTPNNRKTLYHYDSNADTGQQVTTLRGFKLYWAQGTKKAQDLQAKPKDDRDRQRAFETANGRLQPKSNSTQHTRMKPVSSGKKFSFQVHFENLTTAELGALQWVLSVPNCHRLGMGKPLGMGVIELEKPTLHVNERSERYKTLFANDAAWNMGKPEQKQDFTADFETDMLGKLRQQNILVSGKFQQIERINMLLTMLAWQARSPQQDQKEYMADLREFRYRPVLPDPLHVSGVASSTGVGHRPGDNHPPAQGRGQERLLPQRQPSRTTPERKRQSAKPSRPTLKEKPSRPTQYVSELKLGDLLNAKVLFVDEGIVFLEFPDLLNLSAKDVLGKIDSHLFGDKSPEEGFTMACAVVSVTEDDVEFTITCQLVQG